MKKTSGSGRQIQNRFGNYVSTFNYLPTKKDFEKNNDVERDDEAFKLSETLGR
jgi:hypothetical protein